MANTTNLNLYLPSREDYISVTRDISQNMEKIDAGYGVHSSTLSCIEGGLFIVANGNTHSAISAGQYVYVKNNTNNLSEGVYKATSNIASNGTISSSVVTAVSGSVANIITALAEQYLGTGKGWISNGELNNYKTTGIYYFSTGATIDGHSASYEWFVLSVIAGRSDTIVQTLYSADSKEVYVRQYRNSEWKDFMPLVQQIRRVRVKFTGVTITTGSTNAYVQLTNNYSSVLPDGMNQNNIIDARIYSGNIIGAQTIECYSDGIYLYSSHAFTSDVTIDIFYSTVPVSADADKTLTPYNQ